MFRSHADPAPRRHLRDGIRSDLGAIPLAIRCGNTLETRTDLAVLGEQRDERLPAIGHIHLRGIDRESDPGHLTDDVSIRRLIRREREGEADQSLVAGGAWFARIE